MAGTSLGEFVLNILVDAAKGELTLGELVKSMGELEVASVGEIAVLATLAQKLSTIAENAMHTTLGIEHLTSSTGMSADALQRWTYAAQYVGISADTMQGALASISHDLAMGRFNGNFGGLANLGFALQHMNKTLKDFDPEKPQEIVKAFRKSSWFQALKPEDQFTVLHGTELQQLLDIMQQKRISETELAKALKDAPVYTDAELKSLDKAYKRSTEFKQLMESIGLNIAGWFGNAFFDRLDKVGKALKEIDAWAAGPGKIGDKVKDLLPEARDEAVKGAGRLMDFVLQTGGVPTELFQDAPEHAMAQHSTTYNLKVNPTIHIDGAKMDKHALISSVQDALNLAFQGLPPLINPRGAH